MVGALSARRRIWGHTNASAGLIVCALLSSVFAITTGFGIYGFGPWRVWVAAAASCLSIGTAFGRLAWPSWVPRISHARWWLYGLLLGVVWGNWEWAGDPALLPLLRVGLAALLIWLTVRLVQHALSWLRGDQTRRQLIALWPLGLAAAAAFYYGLILQVHAPYVDVWHHMQIAGRTLLSGENPYAHPVPDFYRGTTPFGVNSPGFPYPPLVLLVSTAAVALGIDVRIIWVAMTLVAAVLVRRLAKRSGWPQDLADSAAVLLLFVPRQSFMIRFAYSEPLSGMLLAAALSTLVDGNRTASSALLGLFAGSKQYLAVTVPLLALSLRQTTHVAIFGAFAALPWLPFLAWNPRALWTAAFQTHFRRPRKDALTLTAWLLDHGRQPLPSWLPLGTGLAVGIIYAWRRSSEPAVLSLGLAAVLLPTLLLSPQAFSNYYCLVAWMLILALALSRPTGRCPKRSA